MELLKYRQDKGHFIMVSTADDISLGRQGLIDLDIPDEPAINWVHK